MVLVRAAVIFGAASLLVAQTPANDPAAKYKLGHSRHGEAFDVGPRTRPVDMRDIGVVHVPITTKKPEVQKWFDQGITLLHSFWYYEAERAFRWCLKLEPENAMAWWGLARSVPDETRGRQFIAEAAKRKDKVSERERLYISALEKMQNFDVFRDRSPDFRERNREYRQVLETICLKYPDEVEARAMLALANMWGGDHYGTELIIREVLAKEPNHPGGHHYRIHNWNYHEPETALESCRRYGAIAPGIGHALHMPGHVYATVGMWQEAAISMDAATRVEIRHMAQQMVFPFNYWNYGHNRNYLSYIQEQLGMADAAISGARQLVEAPLDPKENGERPFSNHSQGLRALVRGLLKFERWDEILSPRGIPWRDILIDKAFRHYAEARAWIVKGDRMQADKSFAAHAALAAEAEKNEFLKGLYKVQATELKARMALLAGETLHGLALLGEAAERQYEDQRFDNDPPSYPELLYASLGREYLKAGSPELAVKAFEKALTLVRNDLFSLAGLTEAQRVLAHTEAARAAMARLLFVTADADRGLAVLERAKATGVRAEAADASSPAPQRNYKRESLAKYGPAVWQPFAAPALGAVDHEKKQVTLEEYRGKNVILVFYLGRECLHCMDQLQKISAKNADWKRTDTIVLAISPNTPEDNAEYLKTLSLPGVRVLSDSNYTNAHRFKSYDDFEEMEIHSTILIDKKGRVHWASMGGEPFGDMAFLLKQVERMNAIARENLSDVATLR
jgi:peroxiredoxin/tetratricopeptide (TPR) repeat protein